MRKAVFFPGVGTAYSRCCEQQEVPDLYPETLSALRILARRDFMLAMLSKDGLEFKKFRSALKDKTLPLFNWDFERVDFNSLIQEHRINEEESYFITDGKYLNQFCKRKCRIILVLSGNGYRTLSSLAGRESKYFTDICKNIYAAAFQVIMNK